MTYFGMVRHAVALIRTTAICALSCGAADVLAQCTKDSECKGDRICEDGRCVAPNKEVSDGGEPSSPSSPSNWGSFPQETVPEVDPRQYPRSVRRGGLTCIEALDQNRRITETCKPERMRETRMGGPGDRPAPPGSPGQDTENEELSPRASRLVSDAAFLGTLAIFPVGGFVVVPAFSLHGEIGGRFSRAIGLVAMLNAAFLFGPGGSGQFLSAGPGLRLGEKTHATLSAGATFYHFSFTNGVAGQVLLATVAAHTGIQLVGPLSAHLQARMYFDPNGAAVTVSAGIGTSTF